MFLKKFVERELELVSKYLHKIFSLKQKTNIEFHREFAKKAFFFS